jgi:hypothetical protein
MTTTMTHNKRVAETLSAIVPRVKSNLARMERLVERATHEIRITIGRDLLKAKALIDKKGLSWPKWLKGNFALSESTANRYVYVAKQFLADRSTRFTPITEQLRKRNPNYALPRRSVDEVDFEPAGKTILDGISNGIFIERTLTESKEKGLKKKMALELVDAGFRALSIKAHSDTGGSDEVMRRLSEVRAALKDAIEDGDVYL